MVLLYNHPDLTRLAIMLLANLTQLEARVAALLQVGDETEGLYVSKLVRSFYRSSSGEMKESSCRVSHRKVVQNISGSGNGGRSSFGRDNILQDRVNVMVQGELVLQAEVSRDLASPHKTFLPRNGHTKIVASLPEDTTEVGLAGNMASLPEGTNETHVSQETSGVSPIRTQKRKAPICGQNKKKPASNRQSVSRRQRLADGGLTWKSGKRQSTQIKFKPVQHWCGEKVLYGRIHDIVLAFVLPALKSSTAIPVIFLSVLKYHVFPDSWTNFYRPLWLLSSVINSLYSFYWDIRRDSDLSILTRVFKFKNPSFVTTVFYKRRWVYYWVMGSNQILRSTWTYKLSAHLRHNYLSVFTITTLEIVRRFQWIFFRVKNEWNKMTVKPSLELHG